MSEYSFSTVTEIQLSLSKWKFPSSISLWTLNLKARLVFTLGWCSQGLKFNPPESLLVSFTTVHGHSLCLVSLDTHLCSQMKWTRAWEWVYANPTLQEKQFNTYSLLSVTSVNKGRGKPGVSSSSTDIHTFSSGKKVGETTA